jgi:hypothetical protein
MRRIFSFFFRPASPSPQAWSLSDDQRQQVLALLCDLGLQIVHEARGPVPLLTFGKVLLDRLDLSRSDLSHTGRIPLTDQIPLADFANALKHVIEEMQAGEMQHGDTQPNNLRVMSPTDMIGVGYVFNASDPGTWPVRSGR